MQMLYALVNKPNIRIIPQISCNHLFISEWIIITLQNELPEVSLGVLEPGPHCDPYLKMSQSDERSMAIP